MPYNLGLSSSLYFFPFVCLSLSTTSFVPNMPYSHQGHSHCSRCASAPQNAAPARQKLDSGHPSPWLRTPGGRSPVGTMHHGILPGRACTGAPYIGGWGKGKKKRLGWTLTFTRTAKKRLMLSSCTRLEAMRRSLQWSACFCRVSGSTSGCSL